MNIIIALLVLGVIVIIHELGHFITAKFFKMPVQEFAIGMGPHIYSYEGRKTTYSLRAIPIGGFVSIEGMEIDSKVEDGFNSKPPFQRFIVLIAGVTMNFLLAYTLIFTLLLTSGRTEQNMNPVIGTVTKESKAFNKIFPKDKILEIEGISIKEWSDIGTEIGKIPKDGEKEKELKLKIEREGKILEMEVPIGYNSTEKRYLLGIIPEFKKIEYTIPSAAKNSVVTFNRIFMDTLNGVKQLVLGNVKKEDISGPLGIIKVVGEASEGGLEVLTWLTIMLSINIGIFNLLPFPALDGGRIIFIILEFMGVKVNKKLEEKLHLVGMIILLSLILYITGNDIFNMMER